MEKVCGYKALDGRFYKKESDCEKADLDFKIRRVETELNNFGSRVLHYISAYDDIRSEDMWGDIKHNVLETVAKSVLENSDKFIEIINQKEQLYDELSKLQNLRNSWWLNIKWW